MTEEPGTRSRAALFGHPLHPMIVPFPIAFFIGALATDIVFASTGASFWPVMSKWLLLAGLVMGAVAAILGMTDFASIKRARKGSTGWLHMCGNVIAVLLSLVSLIYRWNDPAAVVIPMGLTISIIVAFILIGTGWLGGELVFRHKIGVIADQPIARLSSEATLRQAHPAE